MGRVRDIIENERGLISDTVATDKEVQATSGYRNHIIDGSFSLCQKDSTPISGTGYSCVDMWYQSDCSIEQSFDAGGLPYAKCTCDDSAAENIISHHLENAKQYLNKSITVSFDMDSPDSLYTNSVILSYSDVDGNTVSLEKTINCTDIRTRYSVTFEFEGTSIPADREALKLDIYGDKSSDNQNGKVFNVYNVQLEFGDVATPFEIEPAGVTLSRTQRYYEIVSFIDSHDGMDDGGHFVSTQRFLVPKINIPTLTILEVSTFHTDSDLIFNTSPNTDFKLDLTTCFSIDISPQDDNYYLELSAIVEADARF